MIKDKVALTMSETKKIIGNLEETEKIKETSGFIKKFSKSNEKKSSELEKEIRELGLIKLNDKEIIKIVDLLPEDAQELNKIFTEVSLDSDETNKILETVKKYK